MTFSGCSTHRVFFAMNGLHRDHLTSLTSSAAMIGHWEFVFRQSETGQARLYRKIYSHSIVPGGFEVMSYTTRFTPRTSFTIRLEIVFSTS